MTVKATSPTDLCGECMFYRLIFDYFNEKWKMKSPIQLQPTKKPIGESVTSKYLVTF